jgi:hypothetical protein
MLVLNNTSHLFNYLQSIPCSKIYTEKGKLKAVIASKIFFVNNEAENRICVRLCQADLKAFTTFNNEYILRVPKKSGTYGWTLVYYKQLPAEVVEEIIIASFCYMAPHHIANLVRPAHFNTWHLSDDIALQKEKKM